MQESYATWLKEFGLPAATFVLGLVSKGWIEARFTRRTNSALENLRAEIKGKEEIEKAVRSQVSTIRQMLIDRSTTRSSAFDQRRIKASEDLWSSVVDLAPFRVIGEISKTLNLEKIMKEAAQGGLASEKLIRFAGMMLDFAPNLETYLAENKGQHVRQSELFVEADAWKAISAYRSMLMLPTLYLKLAKSGTGPDLLKPPDDIVNSAIEVLPNYRDYIEEHKAKAFPYLYDEMEKRILDLLRKGLGVSPIADMATVVEIDDVIAKYRPNMNAVSPPPGFETTTPSPPSQR